MFYNALLLIILLWSVWRGYARGMAWQLAAIAALVLCFGFAAPLSLTVAPLIKVDPPMNRWLAMLAIYLVFSFGSFAAARTVRGVLETFQFQEYDRHLGAVCGLIKGGIACLVLTFFVVALSESARENVLRTTSGRVAGYALFRLGAVMPRELDKLLAPYFQKIEGELIEIADEEQSQGTDRSGRLPFDLDPRAVDRSSDAEEPEETLADEVDQARKPILSPLEQAAESLGDRLRDGVSRIVEGILPGDDDSPDPAGVHEPPAPESERQTSSATDLRELDRLIGEITRAFSSRTAEREHQRALIADELSGIPSAVASRALADWRADLFGATPDPDPRTDIETTLAQRVLRQLEKAGVSTADLPDDVRERLRRN